MAAPPPQHGQLLLTAAKDNDAAKIRELVFSGIPVMMCNQIGQTALHVAALWGHVEAITELISLGADVDVQNINGSTPLHFAAMTKGKRVAEAIDALLAAGASLELTDALGRQAWELLTADDPALRTRLGGPNADLFNFAAANDVAALRGLFAGGAKATARDRNHSSLLHVAAAAGAADVVALLLRQPELARPSDWLVHDGAGLLPLHVAAANDRVDVIEMLVKAGAAVDERSFTNSEYAGGSWESGGRALRPNDKTALHVAVEEGAEGALRALLAAGASPNVVDFDGATPLSTAVFADDEASAAALLAAGADVDGGCKDFRTPLHHAASAGALPMVELLLSQGANPNIADDSGWTPLLLAARRGKLAVAKRLLQAGADVGATALRGDTALHLAAINGNAAMVAALLEGGASKSAVNDAGKAPTDVAAPAAAPLLA